MRGLFVGHFSPFHLGHLETIQTILEEVDELIIVIGSAQQSHTMSDPFTVGERILMIRKALKIEGIPLENIFCIPVYDIFRNPIWVSHVQSFTPSLSIVFTNNSLIRRLFVEAGYQVKSSKLVKRSSYKGSNIRQLMIEGAKWEHLVPLSVQKVISDNDGQKRLQEINQTND
ncbi:MAG: nicotinamide-nucleotide adenylyltransferase [Candidatus Hodarchaeales archaeon]